MRRLALVLMVIGCSSPPPAMQPGGGSGGTAGGTAGGSAGGNSGGAAGGSSGGTAGGITGTAGGGGNGGNGGGSAGGMNLDAGRDAGADAGTDAGVLTTARCAAMEFVHPSTTVGPNYDQFMPVVGSHCRGTNHQNITGVQRVVFLGDSIMVGTPPTNFDPNAVFRSILAKQLATRFSLPQPGLGWGGADLVGGVALPAESGAFISCSKWGARVDDLMRDNHQVEDCIPPNKRNLHHLVVMTMGGNDINSITQEGAGPMPMKTVAQLQAQAQLMINDLRDAITWMKNPANVPGGVDVVFANNYEYTDGTGEVTACPGAALAGLQPWMDVQAQTQLVVWIEEQYMKIAKDTGSDMVFLLESFCGHGYKRNDPNALCYRGPNQALWFDDTCIHPNAAGHAALADIFLKTIAE